MSPLLAPVARFRAAAPRLGCGQLLLSWLAVRTLVWLVLVVAVHPNPPLDLVELLSWGNAWQPGYPKHPPVPCWIAAAFGLLSPGDVWGVYVAGYLASACCVWAAWRVGREYLPPHLALVAALALDGLYYLTGDAAEWNNNVALNLGWALTAWFGFAAVRTGALGWWAATGAAAGVALLCKYTAAVHLAPLAAYLLLSPNGRRQLHGPGPYLAAAVVAAVFVPHAAWVADHDYTTLRFVAARTAETKGGHTHLTNPFLFLVTQAVVLLPVLFIVRPLLGRPREVTAGPGDLWLLRAAVVGPIGLFMLYGVATGCQMRDIWGATFWTFLPVWLIAEFGAAPDATRVTRAVRRWGLVAVVTFAYFGGKQLLGPWVERHTTRAHYPGRALADEVNRRWNARYDRPFGVAAGEAWAAGNIACYSRHKPTLFTDWSVNYLMFDEKKSWWTGDDDTRRRGGVIVWDADQLGEDVPGVVRTRFPEAVAQPAVVLPYQTRAPIPPARVGLAFVPPAAD